MSMMSAMVELPLILVPDIMHYLEQVGGKDLTDKIFLLSYFDSEA